MNLVADVLHDMTFPSPCVAVPCTCGRCYRPGSVVGTWLRRRRATLRRVGQRLLGRRLTVGRGGEVLLPAWVVVALAGGPLADENPAPRR